MQALLDDVQHACAFDPGPAFEQGERVAYERCRAADARCARRIGALRALATRATAEVRCGALTAATKLGHQAGCQPDGDRCSGYAPRGESEAAAEHGELCRRLAWVVPTLAQALAEDDTAVRACSAQLLNWFPSAGASLEAVAALIVPAMRAVLRDAARPRDLSPPQEALAMSTLAALRRFMDRAAPARDELVAIVQRRPSARLVAEALLTLAASHAPRDRDKQTGQLPSTMLSHFVVGLGDRDVRIRRAAGVAIATLTTYGTELSAARAAVSRARRDPDAGVRDAVSDGWVSGATGAVVTGAVPPPRRPQLPIKAVDHHYLNEHDRAAGRISLAVRVPIDTRPVVGARSTIIPMGKLPTQNVRIAQVTRRTDPMDPRTSYWDVKFEPITTPEWIAFPLSVPVNVMILYPAVRQGTAIDPWDLSVDQVPVGVALDSIRTNADLDGDGAPDVLFAYVQCLPSWEASFLGCSETWARGKSSWHLIDAGWLD